MSTANPVATPLDKNNLLQKGKPGTELPSATDYQSLVGSLMYAVIGTRPDLAYTVTRLSQYSSCPTTEHYSTAKRVLRYLQGSLDHELFYPRSKFTTTPPEVHCFSDRRFAEDLDDRRLTSGYIIMLGNAAVSWCCKKQKSVTVSTTEAEYVAISLESR